MPGDNFTFKNNSTIWEKNEYNSINNLSLTSIIMKTQKCQTRDCFSFIQFWRDQKSFPINHIKLWLNNYCKYSSATFLNICLSYHLSETFVFSSSKNQGQEVKQFSWLLVLTKFDRNKWLNEIGDYPLTN